MAKILIIAGWPRSQTTRIGRALSLIPGIYWFNELLRTVPVNKRADRLDEWLDRARGLPVKICACKILAPHYAGWSVDQLPDTAEVLWISKPTWEEVQESANRCQTRGSWVFPVRVYPNYTAGETTELREMGFRDALRKRFPNMREFSDSDSGELIRAAAGGPYTPLTRELIMSGDGAFSRSELRWTGPSSKRLSEQ